LANLEDIPRISTFKRQLHVTQEGSSDSLHVSPISFAACARELR
jgi:hypothetical protein